MLQMNCDNGWKGNSRFNAQDVANSPRLIPVLLVSLSDRVDIVDADDPFVLRELDLSTEIVEMLDQRSQDFSVSGLRLGCHKVDDMVCEVGIVFAGIVVDTVGSVRSHVDVFCLKRRN
jgi:hypothetical protein